MATLKESSRGEDFAGAGQRRKTKDDKGKLSRPSSGKVFGSLDALTARAPRGSAVRSPHAGSAPEADAQLAQKVPAAPAQPAATAPPDLVPAAAPLPPLGAATAAAVAAISKAGATLGVSPGAVAVTISAAEPQKGGVTETPAAALMSKVKATPGEAAKQPASKPGPGRSAAGKPTRQNGRRVSTRYRLQ